MLISAISLIASCIYHHFHTFIVIFNLLLIGFIFHLANNSISEYSFIFTRSLNSISVIIFYICIAFPSLVLYILACKIFFTNEVMSSLITRSHKFNEFCFHHRSRHSCRSDISGRMFQIRQCVSCSRTCQLFPAINSPV